MMKAFGVTAAAGLCFYVDRMNRTLKKIEFTPTSRYNSSKYTIEAQDIQKPDSTFLEFYYDARQGGLFTLFFGDNTKKYIELTIDDKKKFEGELVVNGEKKSVGQMAAEDVYVQTKDLFDLIGTIVDKKNLPRSIKLSNCDLSIEAEDTLESSSSCSL